jgi:hypothetical protein
MVTFTIFHDFRADGWFVARENATNWPIPVSGPFATSEAARDRARELAAFCPHCWAALEAKGEYGADSR